MKSLTFTNMAGAVWFGAATTYLLAQGHTHYAIWMLVSALVGFNIGADRK